MRQLVIFMLMAPAIAAAQVMNPEPTDRLAAASEGLHNLLADVLTVGAYVFAIYLGIKIGKWLFRAL